MNFRDKLNSIIDRHRSVLCLGLDPLPEKIPAVLKGRKNPIFEFNQAIIDATHDLVCAYKPNSAFYEAMGEQGIRELKLTFDYLKKHHPEIPVILDAKRGDIGSTNLAYVRFVFEYLGADAVTLNPYLGEEALSPFLDQKDKGLFFLVKTSNPGSSEFQNLTVEGEPLYLHIARAVAEKWNRNGNCMLVVGATYPEELKKVREMAPDTFILVPGLGAQGGELTAVLGMGKVVINMGRSVIYASGGPDYARKCREATREWYNSLQYV